MPHENKSIQLAIDAAGGLRPLARKLGIKHSSIAAWNQIPLRHLFTIEGLTGIPREQLRPDIFMQPRSRRSA